MERFEKSFWRAGRSALKLSAVFGVVSTNAAACPFCYTAAAAVRAGALGALRSGILVLAIPPMLIFGVIVAAAVRGRHRYHKEDPLEP
jgi:fatty acid desaturase